jgi:hypothetical protein
MTRVFSICVSLWLCSVNLNAQPFEDPKDSTITVTVDAYLKKILSIKGNLYAIGGAPQSILKLNDNLIGQYQQQIMKSDSLLYIHLDGTGIIYKGRMESDSTLKFIRLDNTHNINYNNGGYPFLHNNNIFILGGYGFWKSNGLMKKFNFLDKEWDVAPLSKEIYPPSMPKPAIWFNIKGGSIYLLYEKATNDAIINTVNEKKIQNKTYVLDLRTMTWTEHLPLHKQAFEIITKGLFQLQHQRGFYFIHGIELFKADIISNKIYKMSDKSYSQSFARVLLQDLFFCSDNKIYFKSKKSGTLDSLVLPMEKFIEEPYPIFKKSFPEALFWSFAMMALISISILVYIYLNRSSENSNFMETDPAIATRFTAIELALIELLIEKNRKKRRADIEELNYVLGIKDKNIGLQKKVRSEAIHGINEKFRYLTGYENSLICSERSEADKRYFEYFIPKELIRVVRTIVHR